MEHESTYIQLFWKWCLTACLLIIPFTLSAQANEVEQDTSKKQEHSLIIENPFERGTSTEGNNPAAKKPGLSERSRPNNVVREELQRFFGYENPLIARYLSLPYDVSVNTNVRGYHVEIGYLLFMFLPILLIIGLVRKPLWGILVMLLSLFMAAIAGAHSYLFTVSYQILKSNTPNMDRYLAKTDFEVAPVGVLTAYVYKFFLGIYEPFRQVFNFVSGSKDAITYSVMIGLFVFLFYIIQKRIKHHNLLVRTGINFSCLYWFLWFLLGGGIVWYGYLILPLGILLLIAAAQKYELHKGWALKTIFGSLLLMSFLWIGMTYVVRVSHINSLNKNAGKYLFDAQIIRYQTGAFTERQVFDSYLNNINDALDQINSEDESLIYRAGTAFSFFIRKNDKRVLNDNLFAYYQALKKRYQNKEKIAQVLRASNFKYIIVDLRAAEYDQTPDKSIKRKFSGFMDFLEGNSQLELLATDRVVKKKGQNNKKTVTRNEVFGEIQRFGSYAVFEIK